MVSQEGNPSEHHLFTCKVHVYMYVYTCNCVLYNIIHDTHNEVLLYYTVDLYSRHLGTKLNWKVTF